LGSGEFWWVLVECLVLVDSRGFCLLGSGRRWWVVGFVVKIRDIRILETFSDDGLCLCLICIHICVYIYIYI
jgi:hypothetical protein